MSNNGIDMARAAVETRQRVIIAHILEERLEQDLKWGEQNHDQLFWLGILVEEIGELARALIEHEHPTEIRREAIQAAAVIVAMLECQARAEAR